MKKKPTHGGKRKGSGRKPKYKEETTTISFRVPVSKVDMVTKAVNSILKKLVRKPPENNK